MAAAFRILALGDSLTFGEGVLAEERWPAQFVGLLEEAGFSATELMVLAVTGWTTAELADAISLARLSPPYELVTLLIGVNDQYRGYDAEVYRVGFSDLLEKAIAFAGGKAEHVLVFSIPDYSGTPFAQQLDPPTIRATLARFNEINLEATLNLGAHYVDLTPISIACGHEPDMLAPDGLHPSGKMYALWAKLAMQAGYTQLQGQR